MKFEWEVIHEDYLRKTLRARVLDGWLIRCEGKCRDITSNSMTFLPDKDGLWIIE